MSEYTVRPLELGELEDIYNRIVKDFAAGEYPPYDTLYKHLEEGIQKGFILLRDKMDIAYSICVQGHESGYTLVSLLAVYYGFRGEGTGTAFLEKLKEIFSNSKGIIVEVEKPENAKTLEEKEKRSKRIDFYERSGFNIVPGVDYSIWDIPMHLMVYQLGSYPDSTDNIGNAVHEIYLRLMGQRFIHKMKFSRLI
jgi:GNAT superfamily N-acetyltransferase